MPYFDASNLVENLRMYRDTLGFVDFVMSQNSGNEFVLLSDLDCNIYDLNHPYSVLICEFMKARRLQSALDKYPILILTLVLTGRGVIIS